MESLSVLIADDEFGMRRGAAKVLKRYRIEIEDPHSEVEFVTEEAVDGSEAYEKLQNNKYDLVLLDYKMPGLTGLEVLDKIREEKMDVLPVMVTAYASLEVAVSATKNGAYDFLAKPFTPDELKSVVKKAAQSLIAQRKARELAAEKRRVRFQFISVLAHELKAPLAAVDSYLQLMKRHIAGEDISSYDHIISRSIIRVEGMRKMISDLLDLTRLESGQKKREVKEINIIDAVQMAIENVALAAQERDIRINLHSADKIIFWADSGEMEMIFNNLISNAVKYNKDGGTVDIRIELQKDNLTIDVQDTGFGMTREEQDRLFGEFVRIKNENTRNVMGSGLGLSILKKIALQYNGKVSVKSEKEVGSTFSVILKNEPPEVVEQ